MAEREDIALGQVTITESLVFASGATMSGAPAGALGAVTATSVAATGAVSGATVATTGNATIGGRAIVTGTTATGVTTLISDGTNALLAKGATVPSDAAAGYAKGCVFIKTDGTDHTNTLYANIGTAASANFNAMTIAAD